LNAIINAEIFLKDRVLINHAVIYDRIIRRIIPVEELSDLYNDSYNIIDAKGKYLIPGLIDIHIHGFNGYDFMDAKDEGLTQISEVLPKYGTTSFLPTTVSMDQDSISKAFECIRRVKDKNEMGARILGVHLEGPYINEEKKGAHEAIYLTIPDRTFIEQNLDIIKIVTVAPELDPDFIHWAVKKGLIVSIGHSTANYEQAAQAFSDGAKHVTHLFNGMSGIHHQDPGVVGAALLDDSVSVELIADTIHVKKELFKLIYRAKGKDRILLITDCIRAGGMPKGKYKLGNLDVLADGLSARLETGSLAGSIVTLNKAVYNFAQYASIPLHEAVAMASYNPARSLGIHNEIGSIKEGLRADFSLVDQRMDVFMTIIDGKTVYHNQNN